MKKNKNKPLIVAFTISLFITIFLLFLSISFLLFPDSQMFNEPYYEEPEYPYYTLKTIQNLTDHTYKIEVISEPTQKLDTRNVYLTLDRLIKTNALKDYSVDYFRQTRVFFKQYIHYSYDCDRTPAEINISINLSTSITYIDSDNDKYVSKGDYFSLTIKNSDSNESINLSQYEYEEFDFRIYTDENELCGFIILNQRPTDPNELIASESVSSGGAPLCLIIFVLCITICILLQIYFMFKFFKSK